MLSACRSGPPYQVYVSNEAFGDITILDPAKLEAIRPWGVALSPDEKLSFTANGPSNDSSVI